MFYSMGCPLEEHLDYNIPDLTESEEELRDMYFASQPSSQLSSTSVPCMKAAWDSAGEYLCHIELLEGLTRYNKLDKRAVHMWQETLKNEGAQGFFKLFTCANRVGTSYVHQFATRWNERRCETFKACKSSCLTL